MATVTGPLTVGSLVKAATHASASSQYGKSITSGTKGTAASGWVWKSTTAGYLIAASNLAQQTTSYKITVNWTVPQKGVIISCTGCATATNSSSVTGTTTFTCTSAGTKTITVALSGGSGQNCGKWQATASQSVTAGSTGSVTKTLKINYYIVNGASARTLKKVSAGGATFSNYDSLGSVSGGWKFTHNSYGYGELAGFGPSSAMSISQYSKIYATYTVNATSVLGSNPSSDGQPWLNDSYATYISGSGTSSVNKASNSCYSVLATAQSGGQITVTSWYAS